MEYSVDCVKAKKNVSFVYFWGHTPTPNRITKSCLSQWYDCKFKVDGVEYTTAEQYMMASKARLFRDERVLSKIMSASHPSEYKKLGREIRNFDSKVWDDNKRKIVLEGNVAKFSQNPELKKFLLSTGDSILAEASPYDRIWGIGLDRESAERLGLEGWKGENLLGFILMEVRDILKDDESGS